MRPDDCPKFISCRAPICPLDGDWQLRAHIPGERLCHFLLEAAKPSAKANFDGAGRGNPGPEDNITHADVSTPAKWRRVLAALLEGRSFNRFQAERELHDHCLHSTVATLQAKGVIIDRCEETVPGFRDIPTHVMRYRLALESYVKARELLDGETPQNSNRVAVGVEVAPGSIPESS